LKQQVEEHKSGTVLSEQTQQLHLLTSLGFTESLTLLAKRNRLYL